MKIAFIYDCIYPYTKGGGEKRYYDIAHKLKDEHEVHFFSMKFWKGPDNIIKDKIWYHGVCIPNKLYTRTGRRSIRQAISFGLKVFKMLRQNKFDIIDCAASPYFPVFSCWLYSKITKTPYVVTWFEYWSKAYWKKYLHSLWCFGYLIQKLAIALSPKIISISQLTSNAILLCNPQKHNSIKTIDIGIAINRISHATKSTSDSDLIFVGRLITEKGVHMLIDVVFKLRKTFPDIKCNIIGDGPEKDNLLKIVKNLNLERNVVFMGSLETTDEVYSYLKASKIFVFPSIREGFGIVVLEANACGLPVITARHENNAAQDLIKNGINGFVCDFNSEAITNIAARLLNNRTELLNLSLNSQRAVNKYDWSRIIPVLMNYYLCNI